MSDGRRILFLILIMMVVALSIAVSSVSMLYSAAFEQQRANLVELVRVEVGILAAADGEGTAARDRAVARAREQPSDLGRFGATGEVLLAEASGGAVRFLRPRRFEELAGAEAIRLNSRAAQPIREALAGETGSLSTLDDRGKAVLAAYAPVPGLGLAVVAKIDEDEIRAPYFHTGIVVFLVTFVCVAIGTILIFRVTRPIVQKLQESESRLTEKNAQWEAATDNLPIGFAMIETVSGAFQYVNDQFQDICGFDELVPDLDRFFARVFPDPAYRTEISARIKGGLGEIDPARRLWDDLRMTRSDGTPRRVDVTCIPLAQQGLAILLLWDVTERQEAIDALYESEIRAVAAQRLLTDAIENISEGFALFDAADCLVICNEKYRALYPKISEMMIPGVRFKDLAATAAERGQYPQAEGRLEEWVETRIAQHLAASQPIELNLDGGQTILVNEHPTGDGGIVAVHTDVTILKQTEQQLLQAQKMEAVGQLTGGIAHDFNNILAIIQGNLEFLEEKLGDNERARKLAGKALDACMRAGQLTHRLLAFSRKQHLQPEVLDVSAVVSGMVDLLRRTLDESISVETSFIAKPWPVKADPVQLENAILNLAVNARDAMPGGGNFRVTVENRAIGPDDEREAEFLLPGRYVIIAVQDNGTGMPPEVTKRVFDPFFTTKDTGQGSGLGLSMVYGFVKQSSEFVLIDSTVGEGSTIRLFLPASDDRESLAAGVAEPSEAAVSGGSETILVTEDEGEVRALAVQILRDLGYNVLEADNGPNALNVLDSDARIDLLFTDIVMPGGLNGRELAEQAISRHPGLRVLFTTGYASNHLVGGEDADTGPFSLLTKPYSKAHLAEMVRSTLDA